MVSFAGDLTPGLISSKLGFLRVSTIVGCTRYLLLTILDLRIWQLGGDSTRADFLELHIESTKVLGECKIQLRLKFVNLLNLSSCLLGNR